MIGADGPRSDVRQIVFPAAKFKPVNSFCIGGIAEVDMRVPATSLHSGLIAQLMKKRTFYAAYSPNCRVFGSQCGQNLFGWYVEFPQPENLDASMDLRAVALDVANTLPKY